MAPATIRIMAPPSLEDICAKGSSSILLLAESVAMSPEPLVYPTNREAGAGPSIMPFRLTFAGAPLVIAGTPQQYFVVGSYSTVGELGPVGPW